MGREFGARRGSGGRWVLVALVLATVVLMFGAELIALTTLKNDHAGGGSETWAMIGLVAGAVPLALPVLERLMPEVVLRALAEADPAPPPE